MKVFLRLASVVIIIFLLVSIAGAEGIPNAKSPADVGFSAERLKKISAVFQKDVDKGDIPGAVIMVLRKGKVAYYDTIGFQDRENKIFMARNTIFRIASMSKPFSSLAIMMLAEEGKIQLAYPASRYLTEFKDLKVGIEKKDDATGKWSWFSNRPRGR